MFAQWVRRVFQGYHNPISNRQKSKNARHRLHLELLEARAVPSSSPMSMMGAPNADMPAIMESGMNDHAQHMNMSGSMDGHANISSDHMALMALVNPADATNTVVASGNWSDPSIWSNGALPTDTARIVIPQGMTLTVDSVITQEFKTIRIDGTLRFAPNVNTELRVDTIVSSTTGRLEMGTAANPINPNVTSRIVFADDGAIDRNWDPSQISRGAVLMGPVEIVGARTTHQVSLAAYPTAGATTLELNHGPDGWNVNDEIVITGTQGSTSDEVRLIRAINGTTVTLNQALQLDHIPPKSNLNVYVANTTRNVQFSSENNAVDRRGHIMFMHNQNVNVSNAEFRDLGRTDKTRELDDVNFNFDRNAVGNKTSARVVFTTTEGPATNIRGRYAIHFHRSGTDPSRTPAVIRGSTVVGSPGWGFVNHSSNVDMINNVAYGVHGASFYTEAGDEIGSMVGNIAIRTVNPKFRLQDNGEISVDTRADAQDFGVDGDGFWLSGHLVSMRDNIAAGASGHGIIIWSDGLVEADRGRATVRIADIENGHLITGRETIPTWWAPLAEISNNEASNATIGFRARYIHSYVYLGEPGSSFHEPPPQAYIDTLNPTIDGLTVWGTRDGALLNYNERLSLKNSRFVGIGDPYVRQDGTTDTGVGIDMYNSVSRGPGVVENVTVEGFNMGILAPRNGAWQMSDIHLRNTTDLHIEQATMEPRTLDMTNVTFGALAGTAVAGNEGQRQNVVMKADNAGQQPFWFLMTDQVSLNGQGLYFDQQAATHVPLTAELRGDSRGSVPTEFVGLTNQQLQDTYGTSFGGEITPTDAQTVSWLTSGAVGSLALSGQTDPPLYELRESETIDVVSLGTLTNFDPSQLQTGIPSDEEGEEPSDEGPGDERPGDEGPGDEGPEGINVQVTTGVEYGQALLNGSLTPLMLDFYQPTSESEAPRPLIVMIHGGGYVAGSPESMSDLALRMASRGYVVASIGYRLNAAAGDASETFVTMAQEGLARLNVSAEDLPPVSATAVGMEDAATALNWLSENASAYGIDSSRIALWGRSAGAVTALQSAYGFDDYGVSIPQINAVVSNAGGLGVDSLMEAGEASPFIIHGTDDGIVGYSEAQELQAQAANVGVPIVVKAIDGAGHVVPLDQEVDGVTLFDSAASFIDTALAHSPEAPGDDNESDEGDEGPGNDHGSNEGDEGPDDVSNENDDDMSEDDDEVMDDNDELDDGDGDDENDDDEVMEDEDDEMMEEGDTDEDNMEENDLDDIFAVQARLIGTEESEYLQGFESDDTLTGGGGPDVFAITSGNDIITDFNPDEDVLDVSYFNLAFEDFSVLTSLEAIATNSTEVTEDGVPFLIIDVAGEERDFTTILEGVRLSDLTEENVFFGLDDTSNPPLEFTHVPEVTVELNDGTIVNLPAREFDEDSIEGILLSGNREVFEAYISGLLGGFSEGDE